MTQKLTPLPPVPKYIRRKYPPVRCLPPGLGECKSRSLSRYGKWYWQCALQSELLRESQPLMAIGCADREQTITTLLCIVVPLMTLNRSVTCVHSSLVVTVTVRAKDLLSGANARTVASNGLVHVKCSQKTIRLCGYVPRCS